LEDFREGISKLIELGLTELEAGVYVLLLQRSPLSAYAVAKTLGKSVPNMYKTLSAMAQKGLVMSSLDGTTKVYAPTPLDEYLDQFMKRSADLVLQTRTTFERMELSRDLPRTSIYKLQNTEQVLRKTVSLIEDAEVSISVTADRYPLLFLSAYLTEASARGVNILVNSYIPIAIDGCDVVHWRRRKERPSWPGNILVLVVDGREVVTGFFSPQETVMSALWVNDPYLAAVLHHGRSADTILAAVLNLIRDGADKDRLSGVIADLTEKHIYSIPHDYLFRSLLSDASEENSEQNK
jgi:sugar-specific transcriptional regulator TrmB